MLKNTLLLFQWMRNFEYQQRSTQRVWIWCFFATEMCHSSFGIIKEFGKGVFIKSNATQKVIKNIFEITTVNSVCLSQQQSVLWNVWTIICIKLFLFFFFYLFRCPTSYERAQNTRLHRQLTRAILHIANLAAHKTVNTYKPMEINIERSPQHWFPSEGSNSELFAHENDSLTARPQVI